MYIGPKITTVLCTDIFIYYVIPYTLLHYRHFRWFKSWRTGDSGPNLEQATYR